MKTFLLTPILAFICTSIIILLFLGAIYIIYLVARDFFHALHSKRNLKKKEDFERGNYYWTESGGSEEELTEEELEKRRKKWEEDDDLPF